jgi:UPF0755 protein
VALRRTGNVLIAIVAICLIGGAAAGFLGWQRYRGFSQHPVSGLAEDTTVQVVRGDSFGTVLARLRTAGIRDGHDLEWRLLAKQLDAAGKLKVGEYELEPGMTPAEILRRMRDGRVIQYRFTLVEGWNFRQVRAALNNAQVLRHETPELDDAMLMATLGFPGQHPEGRFLPETYIFHRGASDLDILKQAYQAMDEALAAAWAQRKPDLPLKSAYEALILASIVEKETGQASERRRIAGVFTRRLQRGMLLQTDPTVIYGMGGGYSGSIGRRGLDTDTPYNTYLHPGLPPTPIAMPGKAALQAAVDPAPGDALFFVSKNDGSHVFSATYAQHNAWVDCYQRKRAASCRALQRTAQGQQENEEVSP